MIRFALFAALVAPAAWGQRPPTVRATAEATATAQPDRARINIGVVTQAASAEAAASANARQLEAVIGRLRTVLGPGGEIKTVNYNVHPNYRYPKEGGPPSITGYTASNTVEATTSDLKSVGRVIDAAAESGANAIQSLEFLLKNDRAVRARALAEAALQARANAEAMAAALGLKVERVLEVEESQPSPVRPMARMQMAELAAAATPIAPGPLEVRATVTVTLVVK